jgi:hypothetical protein
MNHLKQTGLGVHNFHNTHNGLPPYMIAPFRANFWMTLMPYMEQASFYDHFTNFVDTDNGQNKRGFDAEFGHVDWGQRGFWASLDSDQRNAYGSIPFLKCPSRRAGVKITNLDWGDAAGPQTDYSMLLYVRDLPDYILPGHTTSNTFNRLAVDWPGWWAWAHAFWNRDTTGTGEWTADGNAKRLNNSPFRLARLAETLKREETWNGIEYDSGSFESWSPSNSLASWRDGTSNQLIFGEKYVHSSHQGQCKWSTNWDNPQLFSDQGLHSDCSGFTQGDRHAAAGALFLTQHTFGVLVNNHDHPIFTGTESGMGNGDWSFGSHHPGVCTFLLGDGSVRTVPVNTSDMILMMLSDTSDGGSTSL